MFDLDVNGDAASRRTTRRVFAAGAVAVIASGGVLTLTRPPGMEASLAMHGTPGLVTIVGFREDGTELGRQTVAKMVKTDGAWFRELGANSFNIARRADTEMAYAGVSWKEHRQGLYRCIGCATALFSSKAKYDSGTGWPSFWAPLAKENIAETDDSSLGFVRTEVQCVRCEAHLGHLFSDGPEPTGLRYCMNSASMQFVRHRSEAGYG